MLSRDHLALVLFIILVTVGATIVVYYTVELIYVYGDVPKPDVCGFMNIPPPGLVDGNYPLYCHSL